MSNTWKPNVVVLGGGTGMPILLRGLKEYPIHLSTVVTVADDGGSTGKIRNDIETPAPGDVRNVITALANVDDELIDLFQYRFQLTEEDINHSLGNIILVAISSLTGSFSQAVQQVAKLLKVEADIFPIVDESITLHAEMEDGSIVSGESNIPMNNKKIKRVFLTPENLTPIPEVVTAILEADLVVISPGSLYTSILPNLIIPEIGHALNKTTANKVYVCNIMTQHGETDHYTTLNHIEAIWNHVGNRVIDSVIVHNSIIKNDALLKLYADEQSFPVQYDAQQLRHLGLRVIEADLVDDSAQMIRHNTDKLAEILYEIALKK